MNRKQKKAKRLNAKAHTKSQAQVYMTPKEVIDEKEWSESWERWEIGDFELEEKPTFFKWVNAGIWLAFFIALGAITYHFMG